jgi:peptidyl-prolyl cis-trans isomerase D
MFDLFRSREKSVRILLGALLLLVALSMLTYLVPNYGTGGGPTDTVVAQIGKDEVTLPEVNKMIQTALRGKQLPQELIATYVPQMVEQLVTERALAYEATRLGFEVSDQDLRTAIQSMIPQLFEGGKFAGTQAYAEILGQQQLTIQEFEADLRRQILISKLREVAVEGVVVSPREIEQAFREKNDKVKIEFVKVVGEKFTKDVEPSVEDMRAYFNVNHASYTEPEKKDLAILTADQAKISESLVPTDADLLKMYNQNKEQFRTPERVQARHILLKTQGKSPADDPKIKAQAEDLLKQLRAGGNFADLAKKYSEDTGSAVKGGDLGWVERGQMVPAFEQTCFSLKPGEISGVIKTEYGYHIVQVMAHQDAHLQTFDEVKTQLAGLWKNAMVNNLMQRISDQAQTLLQKDPLHPDQVAVQLHMEVVRATGIAPGSPVPEIGTNADFDQSLIGLKQGQVSQPVALPGNKLALAVVTALIPARPSTFEEVQNQVKEAMIKYRLQKKVRDVAQELAGKAKANGGDLAAAAKSMGLTATTSAEFARQGTVEGLGPAAYVSETFSRPDGTVIGPIPTPDSTLVVKVLEHVPADMSKLPEEASALRDQLKNQKERERNTLFEAGLRDALKKQGKLKYHQDVIDRLVAQYRAG